MGPSKRNMIFNIFFVKGTCFFENARSSLNYLNDLREVRNVAKSSCKGCDPAGLLRSPKTPEPRKYQKKQNPPPRVGARKYEKYSEKIQNQHKNCRFGVIFVCFRFFFSYFRGPTRGGGFRIFFRICGVLGFLGSVAGRQGHNARDTCGNKPLMLKTPNRKL